MDEMGTVEIRAQSQSDNVDKINNIDKIDNVDTTWLEDDSIDLIAHTVEDFRGQRLSIVQSLRQFVLCYETVLEWIRQLQDSGAAGVDARGGRGRSATLHFS
jgi:protein-tyrosine phosphatase